MPSVNEVIDWLVKRISALTRTATDADLTDSEYMAVDNASAYTRKITVASFATWVLGRIKGLAISISSFRTGDVIPVDGPSGTAKMTAETLLQATAQNALGSIKNLSTTITSFRTGDVIPVDGPSGTAKMRVSTLLEISRASVTNTNLTGEIGFASKAFQSLKAMQITMRV